MTYDYDATQPDELTIKVGDIISDVKKVPGGWWEGMLNGKRGVFPDNFVEVCFHTQTFPVFCKVIIITFTPCICYQCNMFVMSSTF